jgi:hypothetical protein
MADGGRLSEPTIPAQICRGRRLRRDSRNSLHYLDAPYELWSSAMMGATCHQGRAGDVMQLIVLLIYLWQP